MSALTHTRLNFSGRHRPTVVTTFSPGTPTMKTTNGEDAEYVAQLVAGDGEALRPLYERHGRALLTIRLVSLEAVELQSEMPLAQRGLT